jgi:hypothetical protein
VLEVLARMIRLEKEMKGIYIGKVGAKFPDDMTLDIGSPKGTFKTLL